MNLAQQKTFKLVPLLISSRVLTHEDHVGRPRFFADFAPDARCTKPTRRARSLRALRETPLCKKEKGKKKAFNSPSAALVSALASRRAIFFFLFFWWELFLVFFGSFATRLGTPGFFGETAESFNAKPLKCRFALCRGRRREESAGGG